ncbi:MAG: hydrolase [Lentisphaerae bacterium RIFOXYB12_FULL_65_16]|nr:MAG: hydrolase [Lentisphaerae bacterium RIFOXYA12_64_32]OGV88811.1 MAG: hydrolase [Lentisphaerae bacterium RIFOXYB12_FULL_65_16]
MDKQTKQFLVDVVNAVSPTGYEQETQGVFRRYMTGVADEVRGDSHGNLMAVLNPNASVRIMFAGHCDELGFQVNYVDDDGFIYFRPLGGHDQGIVPGRRVTIHAAKGPVPGVIGKKAIHLMSDDERKHPSEIKKLWIDIGAKNKKRAMARVQIGDPVTYNETFTDLDGGKAVARGFDDKIGVFAVGRALQLLKGRKLAVAVYSVSTVQEEIGSRGARTSAFGIDPQVGIAIDVTHASDYPTAEKKEQGDVKIGGGPVITRGPNISPKVFDGLVAAAKAAKIPYQVQAANSGTGTDANAIQLTRAGVATGLVSVPNRYMHTPAELISLDDAENTGRLLAAFVQRLSGKEDWTVV